MNLATSKGIEVAVLNRLESSVDIDSLASLLDSAIEEQQEVPNFMRFLKFFVNPQYRNITHDEISNYEPENCCQTKPVLYGSLFECLVRNFGKGFVIAALATALLDAFPVLLKGRILKAASTMFLPIHLQHGVAFGLFVSVFNSTLYLVSNGSTRQMESNRKKYGWLAGLLAGSSVALAPKSTRVFTAKLTFTRALEVMTRLAYHGADPKIRNVLDKLGVTDNMDTILMMGASGVVLQDYIEGGSNLDPFYNKFLAIQAGLSKKEFPIVSAQMTGKTDDYFCSCLHPEDPSCGKFACNFFKTAFLKRSVPIYLRVFAFPLWLGLMQRKQPMKAVENFAKGVFQSSLFLSAYCTSAWVSSCAVADWSKEFRLAYRPTLAGIVTGATLLIEKKSRRIEVALYVLSHALVVLVNKMKKNGVSFPNHAETFVCMICCSFLMHAYLDESDDGPRFIRPGYRFLLERFLDSKTNRHCTIIPKILSSPLN